MSDTEDEAIIVESLLTAIKARRKLIGKDDNKIKNLEQIEEHYRAVEDKYQEFKELLLKSDKTYIELQQRLNKDIIHQMQTIDSLRVHKKNLLNLNQAQRYENEKLELQLKENVQKLQKSIIH